MSEPTSEPRLFRRRWWPWAALGAVSVLAAMVYGGSPLADRVGRLLGTPAASVLLIILAAGGALCFLAAAALYTERVILDDVAVDQLCVGHPRLRILWSELDQVILYRSRRRPRGIVELRGRGRFLRLDPRLVGFDEIEARVLREAARHDVPVTDRRG